MTNEEIKQLPNFVDSLLDVAILNEVRQHLNEKLDEVCKLAIQALEQQPSEDTEVIKVSKGAVKARQGRFVIYDVDWLKKNFYSTEEKIYGQPKQPCEDCISRDEAKKFLYEEIELLHDDGLYDCFSRIIDDMYNELPPVKPERPKGKWIDFNWNDGDICRWGIKCSECHTEYKHGGEMWHNPKYCPNCGSYNGGGEDEASD